MNSGKIQTLKAVLKVWRKSASVIAALQWNCFFQNGAFNPFFDPATVYRKQGAEARLGILRQINQRFDIHPIALEEESKDKKRKRLAAMAPGLDDILAPLKASLGACEVQMVTGQVVGTLNSYISNRQNDFRQAVYGSSVSDEQRYALFVINKMKAWFNMKRELHVEGTLIDMSTRRLARNVMSQIVKSHRKPRFNRIGMVVDQRIATLSKSDAGTSFDMWLQLRVAGLKESRKAAGKSNPDAFLHIPVNGHGYFNARKGERKRSFQIIEDRHTGAITIGVITDVGEAFEASREVYASSANGPLALDFGLKTMFVTNDGDLLGQDFMRKLKALDRTLSGIARHVQRSGRKPRTSKRYVQHAERTRGYIKTEINRIINKLVTTKQPTKLFMEKLNFQSSNLSRRMNRLLQNCGRSVLQTKLQAINDQFGIETTEVVSAYTSQTCSCCGYADKRNRPNQEQFSCKWCGNKMHADVNASRNIGSERFRSFTVFQPGIRKAVLDALVHEHIERNKRRPGSPSDPRRTNPYFKDWEPEVRSLPLAA
jgi:putative transposase